MAHLYMHGDGDWEHQLVDLVEEFNAESKHVHFASWTEDSVSPVLASKKIEDRDLITSAITLIIIYIFIFLGSCSPTHLRLIISFAGLVTVGFSVLAG